MNKIIIPQGILQHPFYDSARPDVLNYGGIGFTVGHELSHAFDDNGRKYNGRGDLESWWSNETLKAGVNIMKTFSKWIFFNFITKYSPLTWRSFTSTRSVWCRSIRT